MLSMRTCKSLVSSRIFQFKTPSNARKKRRGFHQAKFKTSHTPLQSTKLKRLRTITSLLGKSVIGGIEKCTWISEKSKRLLILRRRKRCLFKDFLLSKPRKKTMLIQDGEVSNAKILLLRIELFKLVKCFPKSWPEPSKLRKI